MKKIALLSFTLLTSLTLLNKAEAEEAVSSSYETPVAEEKKPTSGYEGGFFIRSEDGDSQLKLNARVDTMFFWQSENVPDNAATAENESQDKLSFRLRRAHIILQPSWKNFKGFVLVGSKLPNSVVWIANGTVDINPYFSVEFGIDDPGYDLTSQLSSKWMTMADNPMVVTQDDGEQVTWNTRTDAAGNNIEDKTVARPSFGLPTQVGLFLSGNYFDQRFNWAASVGNGSESTDTLNINHRFQYTLRLSYTILGENPYGSLSDYENRDKPSFAVGVGGAFEHDPRKAPAAPFANQYNWAMDGAADVVFKYRGFSANAAGYYRQIKVGPAATVEAGERYLTDIGYLGTLAMFAIPKKLEVQGFAAQIIREGPDNNAYEFGGGVNYYIHGANAKFQLDYARLIDYDDITGAGNRVQNRVRGKMQLYF